MAHDNRIAKALWLLEALSAAPHQRMSAQEACKALTCSDDELDGYIALLSTLADRTGGGRAIVYRDDDMLVLEGDAATMKPLRLTAGEGMALRHVLTSLNLDHDMAERLERALLVSDNDHTDDPGELLLANTRSFGSCYQQLSEAIADGVRCRITYRAQNETEPALRTVDPIAIETSDDSAYLVAWNIDKQAERRYRLDRMSSVELTEDSVERWYTAYHSVAESLERTGIAVTIECSINNTTPLRWLGVRHIDAASDNPDRQRIIVQVSTPTWLFDQVLAAAGDMVIVAPKAMRTRFIAYATSLPA